MDRERRPCRSSRHFTAPPSSINQYIPEHICTLCGKYRSSKYRKLHPLTPGQTPEPGICSRPKCAKTVNEILVVLPHRVNVYEIHHHHHYHSGMGAESPPPSYSVAEVRPRDNALRNSRNLAPIQEEPHLIDTSHEPEELQPDCAAAELSGECSLAGRVELPDNRLHSRRNLFRKLSPIPEEMPPRVNFLNKPTLQKKVM